MIYAKELRIGNIMQDEITKELLQVDDLVSNGIGGHNIGYYVINREKFPLPKEWEAVPIPLTTEVLERCGFVDGKKGIFKAGLDGDDFIKMKTSIVFDSTMVKLRYLHELQNLYFALSGTELTYTP